MRIGSGPAAVTSAASVGEVEPSAMKATVFKKMGRLQKVEEARRPA